MEMSDRILLGFLLVALGAPRLLSSSICAQLTGAEDGRE